MIEPVLTSDNPSNGMAERNFIDLDASPAPSSLAVGNTRATGVGELCSILERAVKTICLYPPTNPLPDEFRQKFFDILTEQLEETGRLVLVTTDTKFLHDGDVAFERPATEENLAYMLFRDGIRELAFEPGVQRDESDRFLAVLVGAYSSVGTATGVANRLWEAGLPHIRHYTIDRVVSGTYIETAGDEQLAARHQQFVQSTGPGPKEVEAITTPGQEKDAPYAGTQLERFRYVLQVFDNVGQLSDEEQARIKALSGPESERDCERMGLDILFEITRGVDSPFLAEEALVLAEKQYDRCVQANAWEMAPLILEGLRASSHEGTGISSQRLQQALTYTAEARHFESLTRFLNQHPETDLNEVRRFLELFDTTALKPITAMLCGLEHRSARQMVCSFLSTHGGDGVDLIGGFVYDKRWYVVRNVAIVLGEIGQEKAISYLRKAAGHQDRRVRSETLRALQRIGGLESTRILLTFLDDEDGELRTRALRAIGSEHPAITAPELKRRTEDGTLAERDHQEVRELLFALARTGGAAAIPHLMRLATRSIWLARRWFPVKVAAVEALGACRNAEVRAKLNDLSRHRNREIAQAAKAALNRRSPYIEDETADETNDEGAVG